jgi:hypothetical protein
MDEYKIRIRRNTMRQTNFKQWQREFRFYAGFLLSICLLYGCAHQQPQLSASQYKFTLKDENYRLRSISSTYRTESYNELVGENFLAADFDQDGILDRILLGEVSLAEAQRIYEYGLDRVTKENKLQVRIPSVNRYVHESNDFLVEIISFRPANAPPLNEFKIIDQRPSACPESVISVDQNADGTLDDVLKGLAALEKIQTQYAEAIKAGLQKGALVKTNGAILVKEK